MQNSIQIILKFWFEETLPRQHDQVSQDFDFEMRERFSLTYELAKEGLCDDWQTSPEGALAYIILLGVMPHYMFRGKYKAFEANEAATKACRLAMKNGYDQIFPTHKRKAFYTPLLHSIDEDDINVAVQNFEKLAASDPIAFNKAQRIREQSKVKVKNKELCDA